MSRKYLEEIPARGIHFQAPAYYTRIRGVCFVQQTKYDENTSSKFIEIKKVKFEKRGPPLNCIQISKNFTPDIFPYSGTKSEGERLKFCNFIFHHIYKGHPNVQCVNVI